MNFRTKFITDAVALCKQKNGRLTDWEQKFIADIENKIDLTTSQYNTLQNIYNQIK